jgi:predicted transcriptional regulator
MQTIKQEVINAISSLPDNASIEDIMYHLYVIDKIKNGLSSIDKGETLSLDELKKEIETW